MKQEEFYDFIVKVIKGIIKFYIGFMIVIVLMAVIGGIIVFLLGR
ncbi:hypothetical protein [Fusobacterium sp.]|nr:hypothetical protein [Fusobacterium sp.]